MTKQQRKITIPSAENFKTARNFKITILTTSNKFHSAMRLETKFGHDPCPANICLFKVNNRNTKKMSGVCSKLTIKTTERCQSGRSGIFIGNFKHISHIFLVFLLFTLNN